MIASLLKQNLIRIRRSPEFQKRLATNIILGILISISMLNFLYVSINLASLLRKTPGIDPIKIMNEAAFIFFPADFILRLIFQKYRSSTVRPYLILNIPRKKIVQLMLIKTGQSLLNLIPAFVFLPFAISELSRHYSFFSVSAWFLAIYSVSVFNAYLANYAKIKFRLKPVLTVLITGLALLFIAASIFFLPISSGIQAGVMNSVLNYPYLLIVPIIGAIAMYGLNYRLIYFNLFAESDLQGEKTSASREKELKSSFSFLSSIGATGKFILLEIKMIMRNKRPKPLIFMSFIMIFYGLIFFNQKIHSEYFNVFIASFMTGVFVFSYGIIIFGWESTYFGMIMTGDIDFKTYLRSKYYFMAGFTTLLFLIMTFYLFLGVEIYLTISALFLFNIGISPFIILGMATYNKMKYRLDEGMYSQQGRGTQQYLGSLIVLAIQIGIIFALRLFLTIHQTLLITGIIGAAGIAAHNYSISLIEKLFYKNKYSMIEGFRKS